MSGNSPLALPLPFVCPPGVRPQDWAAWNTGQRCAALMTYWRTLPRDTRTTLHRKYGNAVPVRRVA